MPEMRILFMGTPYISIPVAQGLVEAGHEIVAVVTKPDKKSGRRMTVKSPPIKEWAIANNLLTLQPERLGSNQLFSELSALQPEITIVAAYGKLVPSKILSLTQLGCINLHPSLLPKYRGPTPVATALFNGEMTTGITIIRMDEGMDTGPIISQKEVPIDPHETADSLTLRLFHLGANLVVDTIQSLQNGTATLMPQDNSKASYTKLLTKNDGKLDFSLAATQLAAQIRALQPWPGAYATWKGKTLKLIKVKSYEPNLLAPPGQIFVKDLDGVDTIVISTGNGYLVVNELQIEGKQAMNGLDFINGNPFTDHTLS